MGSVKAFGILVEAKGEGLDRRNRRDPTPAGQERPDLGAPVIADIVRDRKGKTPETHAKLGSPGMGWDTQGGVGGIAAIARHTTLESQSGFSGDPGHRRKSGHRRGRRCHMSMVEVGDRKGNGMRMLSSTALRIP
jgi:hypothetical protein